jgi:hypothetical protein
VNACTHLCAAVDYITAGLYNATTCVCGNTFDVNLEIDDSNCNLKCSGNANEICGGHSFFSLYQVQDKLKGKNV